MNPFPTDRSRNGHMLLWYPRLLWHQSIKSQGTSPYVTFGAARSSQTTSFIVKGSSKNSCKSWLINNIDDMNSITMYPIYVYHLVILLSSLRHYMACQGTGFKIRHELVTSDLLLLLDWLRTWWILPKKDRWHQKCRHQDAFRFWTLFVHVFMLYLFANENIQVYFNRILWDHNQKCGTRDCTIIVAANCSRSNFL